MPEKSANSGPTGASEPKQKVPESGHGTSEVRTDGSCDYTDRLQTALRKPGPSPPAPSPDFPRLLGPEDSFPNCAGSLCERDGEQNATVSRRKDS